MFPVCPLQENPCMGKYNPLSSITFSRTKQGLGNANYGLGNANYGL